MSINQPSAILLFFATLLTMSHTLEAALNQGSLMRADQSDNRPTADTRSSQNNQRGSSSLPRNFTNNSSQLTSRVNQQQPPPPPPINVSLSTSRSFLQKESHLEALNRLTGISINQTEQTQAARLKQFSAAAAAVGISQFGRSSAALAPDGNIARLFNGIVRRSAQAAAQRAPCRPKPFECLSISIIK